jgi:NDP-sugar pyrophosphorylase family protein
LADPATSELATGLHAVILAGGRGTRLRPYTATLPKPLVPIGEDVSILEIVLRQLGHQGFTRATIAVGHLGQLIQAYAGDGSQWGIAVDYAVEDEPLGTMGPVVKMLDRLPEHFLVMNGDILTDFDYVAMLARHAASGAPLTVATYGREVRVDFGVLDVEGGKVVGFSEKPTLSYSVSMGIYAISRSALAGYPVGRPFGFDELMADLIKRGDLPASAPFDGYWLDIGRPEDYERANAEFPSMREQLLPSNDI